MTEQKRSPGRPKYTPEERKEASDRSFLAALPPWDLNGCQVVHRKHFIGYDGRQMRTRTFAWNFYHPEDPIAEERIERICKTPGCVSKMHLRKLALLEPNGKNWDGTPTVYEEGDAPYDAHLRADSIAGLAARLGRNHLTFPALMKSAREHAAAAPLQEDSPRCSKRLDFIMEFVAGDDEEFCRIAPEWGIILTERT